ncbi:MAG: hypothetical protein CFE44_09120 [Burkholderiales bacterium PBB4]|nr:MAG: hypothetical protein CFE44_09120 [Burkholderiales bacterium PBB4]
MKSDYDPRNLNVLAFAKAGDSLHADERVLRFERLLEETQGLGAEAPVRYSVQGLLRSDAAGLDEPWISLQAEVVLPLTCQRCLGPVDVQVLFDRDFRFVATEEMAAVEDEESEEDVLVLSRNFNLAELVEDELLMALPVAPKHAECPEPVKLQVADVDFVDTTEEKPNPFAILGQLKKPTAG